MYPMYSPPPPPFFPFPPCQPHSAISGSRDGAADAIVRCVYIHTLRRRMRRPVARTKEALLLRTQSRRGEDDASRGWVLGSGFGAAAGAAEREEEEASGKGSWKRDRGGGGAEGQTQREWGEEREKGCCQEKIKRQSKGYATLCIGIKVFCRNSLPSGPQCTTKWADGNDRDGDEDPSLALTLCPKSTLMPSSSLTSSSPPLTPLSRRWWHFT